MKSFLKITALAGASVVALGVAGPAQAADEVTLDIVSWGGAYTNSQQKAYHDPYIAANPHVTINNDDQAAQGLALLRAQIEAGNVTWDVVDMLEGDAILACDEGLLLEIDYDEVLAPAPDGTPPTEDFLAGSLSGCFIPQIVYATLFGYNSESFPNGGPTTIADVWDLDAFPGKRGLERKPDGNLEWALVADGVAIEDVYDVLSTDEGVDRAFAKLDEIKDEVVWWEQGAQPPQLLADKEVTISTGFNGRFFNAAEVEGQPINIMWDGQLFELDGWVVPADVENPEAVLEYLHFATDTQRLADQAKYISYGPARLSSAALVSTHAELGIDMKPHMPTNPANFQNPIKKDALWWADNGDEMRERFAAWLNQ